MVNLQETKLFVSGKSNIPFVVILNKDRNKTVSGCVIAYCQDKTSLLLFKQKG